MLLIAVLVFLVMRQVMPIAAALAGGASLNSFGVVSRTVGWGPRKLGHAATPLAGAAGRYARRHRRRGARRDSLASTAKPAPTSKSAESWRDMRR